MDKRLRRFTGALGLTASVVLLLQVPFYFVYSGARPDSNILTRILISMCGSALLIPFLTGLRQLLREARPESEWLATASLTAALIWLTLGLVGQSMEAGTAIATEAPIDPTVQGPLAAGQFLLWGSMGRLMCGLFLASAGLALLNTRILPRWIALLAWAVSAINLAFVPSLYFGGDAARFYSAVGWGTTATASSLVLCWIMAASLVLLTRPAVHLADR